MPATAPTDAELIRDALNARLFDLRTCTIARVKSYDAETRTADLIPVIRRPLENVLGEVEHEETCVLPNVPVKWPRAGGFLLHYPLAEGNHVLVIVTDDSIQTWREKGDLADPGDRRQHHLASAVAIPGAFCGLELEDPVQEATLLTVLASALVLGSETTESRIEITDTLLKLGANATQAVALAPALVTFFTALSTWATAVATAVGSPGLTTATATFTTAVTTAAGATPATMVRGK